MGHVVRYRNRPTGWSRPLHSCHSSRIGELPLWVASRHRNELGQLARWIGSLRKLTSTSPLPPCPGTLLRVGKCLPSCCNATCRPSHPQVSTPDPRFLGRQRGRMCRTSPAFKYNSFSFLTPPPLAKLTTAPPAIGVAWCVPRCSLPSPCPHSPAPRAHHRAPVQR